MDEEIQAANLGETETPVVESAPIEETTPETEVETSEKTEIPQPVEEEKTVPLSALQRERELRKQAEEQAAIFTEITKKGKNAPVPSIENGPFDEETAQNLEAWYAKKRAEEFQTEQAARSAAFVAKHEEELKDPLLDAAVRKVIHDANNMGKVIDQEDALSIAKGMLETRLKTAEEKAKTTGFDEGQVTAHKKTLAGAVGETSVKTPPVNPDDMTAEEAAIYYSLPRVD